MKKMTWLAFAVGVGAVTLSGTTVHAAQADLNVTPYKQRVNVIRVRVSSI